MLRNLYLAVAVLASLLLPSAAFAGHRGGGHYGHYGSHGHYAHRHLNYRFGHNYRHYQYGHNYRPYRYAHSYQSYRVSHDYRPYRHGYNYRPYRYGQYSQYSYRRPHYDHERRYYQARPRPQYGSNPCREWSEEEDAYVSTCNTAVEDDQDEDEPVPYQPEEAPPAREPVRGS